MSKNAFLHPLKKVQRKPGLNVAVVDLETHTWTKVVAVGLYDGKTFQTFRDIPALFDYLLSAYHLRYYRFYSHNGGKFDFLPLIDECIARKLHFSLVEIGSRIAQLKIFMGGWDIFFRDSVCLLQSSLLDLTKSFCVEHIKKPFDHDKTPFNLDLPEHVDYLRSDCIGLYEVIQKFFNLPLIRDVKPKLTLSSTALAIHRTMMKKPVAMTSQRIQNFVRQSYAGGRCEIFKHADINLTCSDLNSLYPYCMSAYPIPLEHRYSAASPEEFGFHDVTVSVPDVCIPVLPIRHDNRLIFPTGEFRGVFFSEELRYAVERGATIRRFHSGEVFTKSRSFFEEYIKTFYRMRKEAGKGTALDFTAKLLMNGLYGKFSQREDSENLIQETDSEERPGIIFGTPEIYEKFRLIKVSETNRSPHMLVHIAAAITAWGRIHLHRSGLSVGRPAYCDTDSVFGREMEYSGELGAWKKEFEADYSYFRLPKLYFCVTKDGNIVKAKGFPHDIRKTWDISHFKKSNLYNELERPMTFRSSILKNHVAFSKTIFKKSIISGYTKRVTLGDGINTRPWNFKNGVIR